MPNIFGIADDILVVVYDKAGTGNNARLRRVSQELRNAISNARVQFSLCNHIKA